MTCRSAVQRRDALDVFDLGGRHALVHLSSIGQFLCEVCRRSWPTVDEALAVPCKAVA